LKVQIDENLPPALARALDAIAAIDEHEVVHVTDFAKGAPDVDLFKCAVARGIRVHVTQDHHQRRPVEREAIASLGLTVFVLASGWDKMEHYQKAACLIEWWPKLMQAAQLYAQGTIHRVPSCTARRGRLEQIKNRR
jgi:hypothetical protein